MGVLIIVRKTSERGEAREGAGAKAAKFEYTYFLNDP